MMALGLPDWETQQVLDAIERVEVTIAEHHETCQGQQFSPASLVWHRIDFFAIDHKCNDIAISKIILRLFHYHLQWNLL